MKILNFGSINIDHVFNVDHLVQPGETLSCLNYKIFAGGKGFNQSIALARSGARNIFHAGLIGADGMWLKDRLEKAGAHTDHVVTLEVPTGQAMIQVDARGENAIVIAPGANALVTADFADSVLSGFGKGDLLLTQNEIACVPHLIKAASDRGMKVIFNAAPYHDAVREYPLDLVDYLIINESEGRGISGEKDAAAIIRRLHERLPLTGIVLTRGAKGAIYGRQDAFMEFAAIETVVVDSTAAGDTFVGYFLSRFVLGDPPKRCMEIAGLAASLCVSRMGASDSIPALDEVLERS